MSNNFKVVPIYMPVVPETYSCFTFLPALAIISSFKNFLSHSGGCVELSHCGFNYHFFDEKAIEPLY